MYIDVVQRRHFINTYHMITNSNLLPWRLRPDTYWMYDIYDYLSEEDQEVDIDHRERVRCISQKILDEICQSQERDNLKSAGITIWDKVIDVFSPKSYNYSTDWFDFEITIDEDAMNKYVRSDTWFDAYLKDAYSSYSWFISSMPSTIWERMNDKDQATKYDLESRALCVVSYILQNMDIDLELQEDAYNCIIL